MYRDPEIWGTSKSSAPSPLQQVKEPRGTLELQAPAKKGGAVLQGPAGGETLGFWLVRHPGERSRPESQSSLRSRNLRNNPKLLGEQGRCRPPRAQHASGRTRPAGGARPPRSPLRTLVKAGGCAGPPEAVSAFQARSPIENG